MPLIEAIKISRIKNRVNVFFDSKLFLPLSLDQVVSLHLKSNQSINQEDYLNLMHESLFYLAYDYSLRQIALSPKTKNIIQRKLQPYLKKKILKYRLTNFKIDNNYLIEKIIRKLLQKNLLNDADFTKYFIAKNSKKSRREIEFKLKMAGISNDLISQYLQSDSEGSKISLLLQKRLSKNQSLADFKIRQKTIAYLLRKGFSYEDIEAEIDAYLNSL